MGENMDISFKEACNIINSNKIERILCIEDSKEEDWGKPKSKGVAESRIALFECGRDVGVKSIAPIVAITEDGVLEISSKNKELIFNFNNGMKYRIVLS
ncbi:hypothetical protein [Clostridium kluyveri]|uniref:Uncharacterized protein n=2 Tax=Clostridium kluyveri TaxID=1534 RepID=A0A1L5F4K7_CLOKL|nr:hypothetical protein [Clostridium kluyveri]APM37934.1 hypothetical protein BS101_03880 [Clostridium kluyveri]